MALICHSLFSPKPTALFSNLEMLRNTLQCREVAYKNVGNTVIKACRGVCTCCSAVRWLHMKFENAGEHVKTCSPEVVL